MAMKDQPELITALIHQGLETSKLTNVTPATQSKLAIEAPASTGKSSKPISKLKPEKGESSSSKPLSQGKMTLAQYQAQEKKAQQEISNPAKGKTQITVQLKSAKSKYFLSENFQTIAAIEPEFFDENPRIVANKIFSKGWFYVPKERSKPAHYYQSILEHTKSVELKHKPDKNNFIDPDYSVCKTFKVLTLWGTDLNKPWSFPTSFATHNKFHPTYNYWDYVQTWFNAFLIQSPGNTHSHSWLFMFANSPLNPADLPSWLAQWWSYFGFIILICLDNIDEEIN